jgi:hypothetical protein
MRDDAEVGAPCGPWRDCPYISLGVQLVTLTTWMTSPPKPRDFAGFFFVMRDMCDISDMRQGSFQGSNGTSCQFGSES